MRSCSRFLLAKMVLLAIILLIAVGCTPGETPEEAYAGYDEALADGAIERGWIPVWLPETAVNIQEKHDLDSNASILVIDVAGSFAIPEGCNLTTESRASNLSAPWWPAATVAELPVYDCDNGYLALDDGESRVYFWRP